MLKSSLLKAKSRLRSADLALSRLEDARNFQEFADEWYAFLCAAKNVYTQLEQGAKASPQSRQWFGGKATERRNDPLLQYMYQARNDSEHGVSDVVKEVQTSVGIGVPSAGGESGCTMTMGEDGIMQISDAWSTFSSGPVIIDERSVKLVAVRDRSHRSYEPPVEHKGIIISDNSPIIVAKLTLAFLASIVGEAESLA